MVRDQLSPLLDLATLRPGASSHPYLLEINDHELVFRFPHINLPDSNINEATSHGFLRFSILPLANAPDGVEIDNKAGIYFDFNLPVVTNTSHYTLGMPTSVQTKEPAAIRQLTISPNPSAGDAVVQLPALQVAADITSLKITDINGQVLHEQSMSGNRAAFHLPDLPSGLYFVTMHDRGGSMIAAGKWTKR